MTTDIATAAEFHLTDWWDKNKKLVIQVVGVVAVVALVVSFYVWNKNKHEQDAAEALSTVQVTDGGAQSYVKVADDYSGTRAAARALLLAAGSEYANGKFAEAESLYQRFLKSSDDADWRPIALLGVATSLNAQGKKAEAVTRYQDFLQRYANDPGAIAAKSALAHLYESQSQFNQALDLYQEIGRSAQNTSYGLEAMVSLQNLTAAHPELMEKLKAASAGAPPSVTSPVTNN